MLKTNLGNSKPGVGWGFKISRISFHLAQQREINVGDRETKAFN